MPLLFSLGQHRAMVAGQASPRSSLQHSCTREQALLFKRIPRVVDVQTAANNWLRNVPPELTAEDARVHDNRVLQCLCDVLHIRNGLPGQTLETASLPLTLGGLGVGGSARVLEMVKARHPQVAQDMMTRFRSQRSGCLSSVTRAVNRLLEVGVHVPEWKQITDGLRPEDLGVVEWELFERIRHRARSLQGTLWQRTLVRSQSGPLASVPFTALPIHRISRGSRAVQSVALETPPHASPPQCSRLLVWPSPRCPFPWPPRRSVQQSWGVKRGFTAESAVAQIGNFKDVRVLHHIEFWPFLGSLPGHPFDLPKCL